VICRQRDQHILQADALVEIIEQRRKNAIEANRTSPFLPRGRGEIGTRRSNGRRDFDEVIE
jgi:hypothetical protein